jgi:WD40 repeat protein
LTITANRPSIRIQVSEIAVESCVKCATRSSKISSEMRNLFRKSFVSTDSSASKSMWPDRWNGAGSSKSGNTNHSKLDVQSFKSNKVALKVEPDSDECNNVDTTNHHNADDDDLWKTRLRNIMWHVLEGHTSDVNGVEFVGGRLLVSCSNDKTVRVWQMNDNERFSEAQLSPTQSVHSPLMGHAYGVNAVRVSPFGTILTSGSTDGRIILWSTQVSIVRRVTLLIKSFCY